MTVITMTIYYIYIKVGGWLPVVDGVVYHHQHFNAVFLASCGFTFSSSSFSSVRSFTYISSPHHTLSAFVLFPTFFTSLSLNLLYLRSETEQSTGKRLQTFIRQHNYDNKQWRWVWTIVAYRRTRGPSWRTCSPLK